MFAAKIATLVIFHPSTKDFKGLLDIMCKYFSSHIYIHLYTHIRKYAYTRMETNSINHEIRK